MTMTALPPTDTIRAGQLETLLVASPGVRVLDVRSPGEFAAAHIPGSYNVPLDTLSEHVADLADLDHPVVLVCRSGNRATKAHAELTAAGKNALHILDGGIVAWEAAGGEVVHGENTTWAMDRQVRLAAGSIALAALVASVAVPRAKWLAAGVAGGLVFSAVTDTCALAGVLGKLPYNRGDSCDIDSVLEEMRMPAAA